MNHFTRAITALFLCYSSSIFAMEFWDSEYVSVFTLTGGVAISNPGSTQTIYFSRTNNLPVFGAGGSISPFTFLSPASNTYIAHKKTQGVATGEFFLGLQWVINQYLTNQLGVAFGGASGVDLQGTIDIDYIPTGSHYIYHTNHGKVVARDKLLFATPYTFQPFLTGSYGASFNKAHGFFTAPGVDPFLSAPFFEDNTNSFSYTYSVGLGVQQNINSNWNMSLGYEFADWGQSRLGKGEFLGQIITVRGTPFNASEPGTYKGPVLKHVYTHNILLSLSYLC